VSWTAEQHRELLGVSRVSLLTSGTVLVYGGPTASVALLEYRVRALCRMCLKPYVSGNALPLPIGRFKEVGRELA